MRAPLPVFSRSRAPLWDHVINTGRGNAEGQGQKSAGAVWVQCIVLQDTCYDCRHEGETYVHLIKYSTTVVLKHMSHFNAAAYSTTVFHAQTIIC